MNDRTDPMNKLPIRVTAIAALAIVAALVLAAVFSGKAVQQQAAAPVSEAAPVASETPLRLSFEAGSAKLAPDSSEALVRLADAARVAADSKVLIYGFYPKAAGASEAELASARAQAVRHALEANGVAAARLQIQVAEDMAEGAAAGRVEMLLRQ